MNKFQALHSFWSGFDIPAYDENSVPDDAVLPYITYDVSSGRFDNTIAETASLWYRNDGWSAITEKMLDISDYLGRGGRLIAYDNGAMWIKPSSPFAQRSGDANDTIRRIIMNLEIEFVD